MEPSWGQEKTSGHWENLGIRSPWHVADKSQPEDHNPHNYIDSKHRRKHVVSDHKHDILSCATSVWIIQGPSSVTSGSSPWKEISSFAPNKEIQRVDRNVRKKLFESTHDDCHGKFQMLAANAPGLPCPELCRFELGGDKSILSGSKKSSFFDTRKSHKLQKIQLQKLE